MKLQFRHQKFQSDAATAVCDVFSGQPFHAPTYMVDPGLGQMGLYDAGKFTGFNNAPVVIGDDNVLEMSAEPNEQGRSSRLMRSKGAST